MVMSIRKIFRNEGLLRDENLNDVPNKRQGLTNLLNNLVSGDDLVFVAADLDPIQNISTTRTQTEDLEALANITVDRTQINDEGNVVTRRAEPFVTIKNQLDSIIEQTDDPPFFSGGDGLNAEFWEQFNISDSVNKSSNGDDIFIGPPQATKSTFWDNGFFEFSGSLDDTLGGSNGGIQWDGFYIPTATGTTLFRIETSGFFMLELEDAQGNFSVVKNIYAEVISVTAQNSVNNGSEIQVSEEDARHIAEEAQINPQTVSGVTVDSVDYDPDTDIWSVQLNGNITINAGETFDVSIANTFGSSAYRLNYNYRNLVQYIPRRIRFTLWFPGTDPIFYKALDVNFEPPDRFAGNLPFWYLYSEVNQDTGAGFKDFFDNRILRGGGAIGPEEANSSTEYLEVATVSPLQVDYEPPTTLSDITKAVYTYDKTSGSPVLSTTSTSRFTSNLEVGNIVIGEGVVRNSQIINVATNSSVVLDNDITESGQAEYRFVDHRGFVELFNATSSGSSVTINAGNTLNLKSGMVVITQSNTSMIRILSVTDNLNFETDNDLAITDENIFVYYDRGIDNKSLDNFCQGVIGKEISGNFSAGSTTLTLNNTDGLSTGLVVQAADYIDPNNTTVENINGLDITISNPTLAELTDGITIVFAPAGTTLNKEQCVIPLNTAPPFVGTDTGLATDKNVNIANGTLNVISLNASNASVTETVEEPPYDIEVPIDIQGSVFKILGSTT
jgi:hypothetical protein